MNSSSSSSFTDSNPGDNPFSSYNIVQWFFDDTYSKLVQQYIQLHQQQTDEASSSRRPRKPRQVIERGREDAHQRLYNDYFAENPTYPEEKFRRRYCMRRNLFLRIVEGVKNHDPYFQATNDWTVRQSFSALQKCTAAMRMLAYGTTSYNVYEYLRIAETTTTKCVKRFVKALTKKRFDEYLRRPNAADIERLLHVGQQRGFPGMLGSIDCMHWE
ncbi:hypothetical protein LINPERHAP1_LOCUS17238 [Linum perenne]